MSHDHRRPDDTKQLDAQRTCVKEGFCRPRARSSKNTRDWCRGKVGVPHAYLWEVDQEWMHRSFRGRWVYQRRCCFGCGRKSWAGGRKHFCERCGSPPRYFHVSTVTGERAYPRRTARGFLVYEPNTTQYGPYCLCPSHFHPYADPCRSLLVDDRPLWADDPVQIAALTQAYDMTLHDFRNLVLSLKGLITDPDDLRALEQTIKNVAEYRTITQVDSDTVHRLVAKYTTAA